MGYSTHHDLQVHAVGYRTHHDLQVHEVGYNTHHDLQVHDVGSRNSIAGLLLFTSILTPEGQVRTRLMSREF